MTKYSCLLVGNQNVNNLVHAPRSCSRKQRLTLCSSEEPLLPLLDEEDALLLELVRGLRGEGGNLALVEPHPPHRLHRLQEIREIYFNKECIRWCTCSLGASPTSNPDIFKCLFLLIHLLHRAQNEAAIWWAFNLLPFRVPSFLIVP